jgi:hypothetical protein
MLKNEKETYQGEEVDQVALYRIDFSYFSPPVIWLIGSFNAKTDLFIEKVA